MNHKFKVGDQVEIKIGSYMGSIEPVKGFKLLGRDKHNWYWYDSRPHLRGKKDIINEVTETQGKSEYRLVENGSWFGNSQLKLLFRPKYKK
jgi:hypothetical protein